MFNKIKLLTFCFIFNFFPFGFCHSTDRNSDPEDPNSKRIHKVCGELGFGDEIKIIVVDSKMPSINAWITDERFYKCYASITISNKLIDILTDDELKAKLEYEIFSERTYPLRVLMLAIPSEFYLLWWFYRIGGVLMKKECPILVPPSMIPPGSKLWIETGSLWDNNSCKLVNGIYFLIGGYLLYLIIKKCLNSSNRWVNSKVKNKVALKSANEKISNECKNYYAELKKEAEKKSAIKSKS